MDFRYLLYVSTYLSNKSFAFGEFSQRKPAAVEMTNFYLSMTPISYFHHRKTSLSRHRVPKGGPSLNISNMKKDGSFSSRIHLGFT